MWSRRKRGRLSILSAVTSEKAWTDVQRAAAAQASADISPFSATAMTLSSLATCGQEHRGLKARVHSPSCMNRETTNMQNAVRGMKTQRTSRMSAFCLSSADGFKAFRRFGDSFKQQTQPLHRCWEVRMPGATSSWQVSVPGTFMRPAAEGSPRSADQAYCRAEQGRQADLLAGC